MTFIAEMLSIYADENIRKIPSFLKLNSHIQKAFHGPELLSASMTACSTEHH